MEALACRWQFTCLWFVKVKQQPLLRWWHVCKELPTTQQGFGHLCAGFVSEQASTSKPYVPAQGWNGTYMDQWVFRYTRPVSTLAPGHGQGTGVATACSGMDPCMHACALQYSRFRFRHTLHLQWNSLPAASIQRAPCGSRRCTGRLLGPCGPFAPHRTAPAL